MAKDIPSSGDLRPQAKKLLADKATSPDLRSTMVMTAVIMGPPVQG
jgi:hypothetical protein